MRFLIRLFVGILMTAIVLIATTSPASAHTVSGSGATNYRTSLSSFQPATPGVTLTVQEAGNRMQLKNTNVFDVTVLGYSDEPYIKVGPSGVYENVNSPSYFSNKTRYATSIVPSSANAAALPNWHRTSSSNIAVWHDHRVHWMSLSIPPQVAASQETTHVLIPNWSITVTTPNDRLVATGA